MRRRFNSGHYSLMSIAAGIIGALIGVIILIFIVAYLK
jgi:hypothetical protein